MSTMLTKKMGSGIDWIAATKQIDVDAPGDLWSVFKRVAEKDDVRPMRLFGFTGEYYKDCACGHVFYGENYKLTPPRELLQIGGHFADLFWLQVFNSQAKITRIDVKVDTELRSPSRNLAKLGHGVIKRLVNSGTSRVRSYDLRDTSKGQTLYIGSRLSGAFGRMYDKSAQLSRGKEAGKVWRYEVQFNEDYAPQVAEGLGRVFNERPREDGLKVVARLVYDWWNDRGIVPVFDLKAENVERIELTSESRYGDKMLWLRTQVSPSVRRLVARGYGPEVLKALGIDEYVVELGKQMSLPKI